VYHFESAAAKQGISLRHCDYVGYVVPLDAGDPNFQFNVVAATTNDPAAFSLTPIAFPSYYLNVLHDNATFAETHRLGISQSPSPANSSFFAVPGLSDPTALSFVVSEGPLAGMYVSVVSGKLSGACAKRFSAPAGDLALTDGSDAAAATWIPHTAPSVALTVDVGTPTHTLNARVRGCHSDSGYVQQPRGLSAQMVYGEAFEKGTFSAPSPWYAEVDPGVDASIDHDPAMPFNKLSSGSCRLNFTDGTGRAGLVNRAMGGEGMYLVGGRPYEGVIFAAGTPGAVITLQLQDFSSGNAVLATTTVTLPPDASPTTWSQMNFSLTPASGTTCVGIAPGSDPSIDCVTVPNADHICVRCGGQLYFALTAPSVVHVGYVTMQPGEWGRFAGLPVLASAVASLQAMGVTVMRQGGSFSRVIRWKDWVGQPWARASMGLVWRNSLVSGW
jgi:hypothetical protein